MERARMIAIRDSTDEIGEMGSRNSRQSSDPALLTVNEVAQLLQVPISWVYEQTRKRSLNRIPGFRLGKYWRFRANDIREWVERQRVGMRTSS
jgi:excisionase family DNA binding protein